MARDGQVSDILKQLEVTAGLNGSFLTLNNQLSQLQEDDRVGDVYSEGDILTAVKLRHHQCRNFGCHSGDLAVLVRAEDRQPIIVETSNNQSWQWNTQHFLPTLAVFR